MKLNYLAIIAVTLILQACATPHVVKTTQVNDMQLSCQQLKSEIADAESFEQKARDARKVNSKNVAAAVLFWPALFGTYSNTEEAINAAKERQAHLIKIYQQKHCR